MLKICPSAGWCFWGRWGWRWRPFKKRGPWGKVGLWFLLSLPTCLLSFPSLSPPTLLSLVSWLPQVKRQSHVLITRNCATADPKQQGQGLQFLTFWVRINPSPFKADLSRVFVTVAENSHAIGGGRISLSRGGQYTRDINWGCRNHLRVYSLQGRRQGNRKISLPSSSINPKET